MKNKFKIFLIIIFRLFVVNNLIAQSCEDEPKNKNCKEPKSTSLSDKVIRICKDCHFGGSFGVCASISCGDTGDWCQAPDDKKKIKSDPVFRVLKFDTYFRESTIYDFSTSANQHDWNKLMRILSKQCAVTFLNFGGSQYYLSLGWRWRRSQDETDPGKKETIELALYGHIDHRDEGPCDDDSSGRVAVLTGYYSPKSDLQENSDNDCCLSGFVAELVFSSKGYFVRAANKGVAIRRDFTLEVCPIATPAKTKVRKDAFFGGQKCAPHKMKIEVRSVEVDHAPTWWTDTWYKGYAGSEFYAGETVVIYAKDSIKFIPTHLDQGKTKKYSSNTIHCDANVTARVDPGGEINCDPGTFLTVEIGANVDCRPLNSGEPAPSNIDPAFSPVYTCPPPGRWSGEEEEETETMEYDTIFVNKNKDELLEKYTIARPILAALPNPFKVNVIFEYELEQDGPVELFVSNIQGKKIEALVNETNKPAGRHLFLYYASHLKPGIYLYTLKTKDHSITKRLVALK